jgi:16S rRNA (cytosine967-C5)-methyltransferase
VAAVKAFLDFERGLPPREPPPHLAEESERRMYTRLLSGLLRHKRLLEAEVARLDRAKDARRDRVALALAMVGLLQLRELEIPAHAALYETVEAASRLGYPRAKPWINGLLRAALRERESGAPEPAYPLAVRTSHPDWMVERWLDRYGEARCAATCEANNDFPGLAVRVETGTERDELIAALEAEGVRTRPHPLLNGTLVTDQLGGLLRSAPFREGRLFVQDAASQLLIAWTAPLWHGRVLDACAAPGGKLTHLLRLAGPEGESHSETPPRLTTKPVTPVSVLIAPGSDRFGGQASPPRERGEVSGAECSGRGGVSSATLRTVAMERNRARLGLIRENCARLRLPVPPLVLADAARPPFPLASFDAVLLDVPCLSTGIIRKYPEIKWRKREDDLAALAAAQAGMLAAAAEVVRPGGRILYSTCSLEPEENEGQVDAFLRRHPGFARLSFGEIGPPAGFHGDPRELITDAGDFQALPGPHWMGLYAAVLGRRS